MPDIKSHSDTLGNNFQKFWLTFRKAVIENDTLKIAELTRFPFETRGEMDTDPIVKFDRTNFFKVLKYTWDKKHIGMKMKVLYPH